MMVKSIRATYRPFRLPVAEFAKGWGREAGEAAFLRMDALLRDRPERIVHLDLEGVEGMDASCSREALANLVKRHVGPRAFFADGRISESQRENIEPGFQRFGLSLLHRPRRSGYEILGTPLKPHLKEVLDVIEKRDVTTAREVASRIDMQLPACNNRLRDIVDAGLALRIDGTAETGGREYLYLALRA